MALLPQVNTMSDNDQSGHVTRGERRQDKRRRQRKMGVSGKSFVNAIRNAIIKRRGNTPQESPGDKGKD